MKKLLITVNGIRYDVEVEVVADDEATYHQSYFQPSPNQPSQPAFRTPPAPQKAKNAAGLQKNVLYSPLNGVVVDILATVGKHVKQNDVLLIVEAMKMNTNISSPFEGVVKSIEVSKGDNIEPAQALVIFE